MNSLYSTTGYGLLSTLVATCCLVVVSSDCHSAPIFSDGSIYFEDFAGDSANDPNTNVIGAGATISSEAGQIVTTTSTEGVVRAGTGLGIAATTEYVLEFDLSVNAASGDNFYALYSQGSASPFRNDIQLRVFGDGSGDWEFQVDHGGSPNFAVSDMDFSYGQAVHFTVHHTANSNNDVDLYVDGTLFGTFPDRAPALGVDLIQFGDSSGGAGFGDATVDNISIGQAVPEPSTAVLVMAALLSISFTRKLV